MELVERAAALEVLEERLRSVRAGPGHCMVVAGEAGIGKTSLLRALAERRGDSVLWWGECVALQTPHPLAPLYDIARSAKTSFHSLLQTGGDRAALFESILSEVQASNVPVLIVIEDAHWADEATLDFLKFIGRRVEQLPCLLALSFRDDEISVAHPLRRIIGDIPARTVTRVEVERLSAPAVEELARRAFRSPDGIFAATLGNPFFTTELLRHGRDGVPHSVQDLVLARFARLSPPARAVVQLVSMVPANIERGLVDQLAGCSVATLEECLNSRLIVADDTSFSFRHELAREGIESSVSLPVARTLHAGILGELVGQGFAVPPARLVHHAVRAGDGAAVRRYAPEAALQAQQSDAHRDAAAQYRLALDVASDAPEAERLAWLAAYAHECGLTGDLDAAIAARRQLGETFERTGDRVAFAGNLSALAMLLVGVLRNAEADAASRTAIEILEALPAGVELATAYRVEAHLRMLDRDIVTSIERSTKAIALAGQFAAGPLLMAARGTLGTALLFADFPAGRAELQRALEDALRANECAIAATVLMNLGSGAGEVYQLHAAEKHLNEAVAFADAHQFDSASAYGTAWLALCEMYLGRWEDARLRAASVLQRSATKGISRVMALVALGRLAVRNGDPDAGDILDEALGLAMESDTLQRIAPVRAARAEAAWMRGDPAAMVEEARPALQRAIAQRHPWFAGELAYWLHRANALDALPEVCAEPFALEVAGRYREAAHAWAAIGCPFEQARALNDGDDEDRLQARKLYEGLGLRAAGVRRTARGNRASTQSNVHQLTTRELEVLELLCEGLKNADIAERLSRSVRTIDHHVAATFAKLGVSSRSEAVAVAARSGIRSQSRQEPA